MSSRFKKFILLALATALLFCSGRFQNSLNRDRDLLGLTSMPALENAPPLLGFTTVALGGFRGLISNYLWSRANDLQLDGKFFEAAQLANWITDLEPHFPQVWIFQAWNMAYNISVKFKENAPGDYSDRWHWVENGISLLRDRGLRYNPDNVLMYRELAWFFQHKMGANLDEANLYYKQEWALEMTPFFGPNGTNFGALLNPQTAEEKTNAFLLRERYKIDPAFAKKADEQWGPLDWRLPEAHAIYWYAMGLERSKENPGKANSDDLIRLRYGIYQSMQQAFRHGRIITDPFNKTYALVPNLDLIPKVNDAYETEMREAQPQYHDAISIAHRNFLSDAVYFLYENNRMADAAKWFRYLAEKYPDHPLLEGDANSLPRNLSLDEYAVARVQGVVREVSQEQTTSVVEGLLARAYYSLAIGQDDSFEASMRLASKVYEHYQAKIIQGKDNPGRVGLPPFDTLNRTVLNDLIDPQRGLPYAMRAVIRTQLRMPAETSPPAILTNAITPAVLPSATNAPATNSIGK